MIRILTVLGAVWCITLAADITGAAAQAPCKPNPKTASLLDQLLNKETLADLQADQEMRKEAHASTVVILRGDVCIKFILNKTKAGMLAKAIIDDKLKTGPGKSAMKLIESHLY